MASLISISKHERPYNRRRTENTIFQQDYLKQWHKIQGYKPVLETATHNKPNKPQKANRKSANNLNITTQVSQPSMHMIQTRDINKKASFNSTSGYNHNNYDFINSGQNMSTIDTINPISAKNSSNKNSQRFVFSGVESRRTVNSSCNVSSLINPADL